MSTIVLAPLPEEFSGTVVSLHRVAEELVAPARKPDNEIALEPAPGGFGTPEFDHDGARHRVRVEGADLIHEIAGSEWRQPLSSLAAAAPAVSELLPDPSGLSGEPLNIDPASALALGDWYAFGGAVLCRLVAAAGVEDDASMPILWPEHFDIAIELGREASGARANFGLSPGDAEHAEPYLYVGPWTPPPAGALWNASGFDGAEMGYSELIAQPDQEAAALDFFERRRDALASGRSEP